MHPAKEKYLRSLHAKDHLIMWGAVRPWYEKIKNFFQDIWFLITKLFV